MEKPAAESSSKRFLRAFNRIEKHLKVQARVSQSDSFSSAVKAAAGSDGAVRRNATHLLEYAELRNAIVHDGMGKDHPIAEPHEETVAHIERILGLLTTPPQLLPTFKRDVEMTSLETPVGHALKIMFEKKFSQLPVYQARTFVSLLTTDTVARWLADQLTDIELVEEAEVAMVLPYAEDAETWKFVARDTTPFEASELFHAADERGVPLNALLITHSGRSDESLLGIITLADFPELLRMVS